MAFLRDSERQVLEAVAGLANGNPFLPERIDNERRALGSAFVATAAVWHAAGDSQEWNPNIFRLAEVVEDLAARLRARLVDGERPTEREAVLYEALIRYVLYERYVPMLYALIDHPGPIDAADYARFVSDTEHFLRLPALRVPFNIDHTFILAWGYQIRRAFYFIHRQIFGGSMPIARLRATVWESIFTHDAERYRRALYHRMGDITTLITGASGTGKELVARAIGLSRFIPFDAKRRAFNADGGSTFYPVNLSALSPTLIESELFGHRRGSFTGAVEDRPGWLETCSELGTVFLDEIGDLDPAIQVKLLRVLQSQTFQRIGETEERRFTGKIIAATHRDLGQMMRAGVFRQDLYYRLCADVIRTPTLREQLADRPDDLHNLVLVIARRVLGEAEAGHLADETVTWILKRLGADYPWPGNVRELEQCIRNVMIRGAYDAPANPSDSGDGELASELRTCRLTAEELITRYCVEAYARLGSYQAAADRLGLDRRTVRLRVEKARRPLDPEPSDR